MYGTRSTEKPSVANFKHTHVLAFNKICGFGKVILKYKYELIFIYTINDSITTDNFLTTHYCQVMSMSFSKKICMSISQKLI